MAVPPEPWRRTMSGLHEALVELVGDFISIDVVGIKIDTMAGFLVGVTVVAPHPELAGRDQHHLGTMIVGSSGPFRAETYSGRGSNK